MENNSQPPKPLVDVNDPEYFTKVKTKIEYYLAEMKKLVDNMSQMRVEAAYLESDLVTTINAASWAEISEMIGLNSFSTKQDPLNLE